MTLDRNYLEECEETIARYENLSKYLANRKVKLVLLEVPYFSIKEFNRHLGHRYPEEFKKQDTDLILALDKLNKKIRDVNKENQTIAPKFSVDLKASRSTKGKRTKYSINYNVYNDGIHPKPLLAKYWMRKIEELARRDCY